MSPVVILSCLSSDLMEQVVLVWFVCLGFFFVFCFLGFFEGCFFCCFASGFGWVGFFVYFPFKNNNKGRNTVVMVKATFSNFGSSFTF